MTLAPKESIPDIEEIKAMMRQQGPCLTIVLSLATTDIRGQAVSSRIRAARQASEVKVAGLSLTPTETRAFLDPVQDVLQEEFRQNNGDHNAVAVYRSGDSLWRFRLPYVAEELVSLDNRFYIRPLLPLLSQDMEFYILALSQNRTRLIRCTQTSSDEVKLPASVPTNLADFNQHAQPDHRLENRAHGGQVGTGMVVAFGTGSDAEQKTAYLHDFFSEIDRQLQAFLRNNPLPMVVAAVDRELSLFQKVSSYSGLVNGGVQGAPDGLKGGELHARALEVMKAHNSNRAERALTAFDTSDRSRVTSTLEDTVRNAFDGRVLSLFLANDAHREGEFDETSREVKLRNGADLLNLAALQTILHRGTVFDLPREKMPQGCEIAALLRY